jgi:flagellar biosynthesis activator protein FlaF
MQHGAQAYRAVAKEIASPRDLEANLLLKAAARLQAVIDSWDQNKSDLNAALLYNRKLWTVFLGSAMSADNPLPSEIRQNVANLGMYIMSQTIAATSKPQVEIISSLVSINRELAAGLRGQGTAR